MYMKKTTAASNTSQSASILIYWLAFLVPSGSERPESVDDPQELLAS